MSRSKRTASGAVQRPGREQRHNWPISRRCRVLAQRKFAQGAPTFCESSRAAPKPIKQVVQECDNVDQYCHVSMNDSLPSTEDFIKFLCYRGTDSVPSRVRDMFESATPPGYTTGPLRGLPVDCSPEKISTNRANESLTMTAAVNLEHRFNQSSLRDVSYSTNALSSCEGEPDGYLLSPVNSLTHSEPFDGAASDEGQSIRSSSDIANIPCRTSAEPTRVESVSKPAIVVLQRLKSNITLGSELIEKTSSLPNRDKLISKEKSSAATYSRSSGGILRRKLSGRLNGDQMRRKQLASRRNRLLKRLAVSKTLRYPGSGPAINLSSAQLKHPYFRLTRSTIRGGVRAECSDLVDGDSTDSPSTAIKLADKPMSAQDAHSLSSCDSSRGSAQSDEGSKYLVGGVLACGPNVTQKRSRDSPVKRHSGSRFWYWVEERSDVEDTATEEDDVGEASGPESSKKRVRNSCLPSDAAATKLSKSVNKSVQHKKFKCRKEARTRKSMRLFRSNSTGQLHRQFDEPIIDFSSKMAASPSIDCLSLTYVDSCDQKQVSSVQEKGRSRAVTNYSSDGSLGVRNTRWRQHPLFHSSQTACSSPASDAHSQSVFLSCGRSLRLIGDRLIRKSDVGYSVNTEGDQLSNDPSSCPSIRKKSSGMKKQSLPASPNEHRSPVSSERHSPRFSVNGSLSSHSREISSVFVRKKRALSHSPVKKGPSHMGVSKRSSIFSKLRSPAGGSQFERQDPVTCVKDGRGKRHEQSALPPSLRATPERRSRAIHDQRFTLAKHNVLMPVKRSVALAKKAVKSCRMLSAMSSDSKGHCRSLRNKRKQTLAHDKQQSDGMRTRSGACFPSECCEHTSERCDEVDPDISEGSSRCLRKRRSSAFFSYDLLDSDESEKSESPPSSICLQVDSVEEGLTDLVPPNITPGRSQSLQRQNVESSDRLSVTAVTVDNASSSRLQVEKQAVIPTTSPESLIKKASLSLSDQCESVRLSERSSRGRASHRSIISPKPIINVTLEQKFVPGLSSVSDLGLSTVSDAGLSKVSDPDLSTVSDPGLSKVSDPDLSTVSDPGISTVKVEGSNELVDYRGSDMLTGAQTSSKNTRNISQCIKISASPISRSRVRPFLSTPNLVQQCSTSRQVPLSSAKVTGSHGPDVDRCASTESEQYCDSSSSASVKNMPLPSVSRTALQPADPNLEGFSGCKKSRADVLLTATAGTTVEFQSTNDTSSDSIHMQSALVIQPSMSPGILSLSPKEQDFQKTVSDGSNQIGHLNSEHISGVSESSLLNNDWKNGESSSSSVQSSSSGALDSTITDQRLNRRKTCITGSVTSRNTHGDRSDPPAAPLPSFSQSLSEVPVFRPTLQQFSDPLSFLQSVWPVLQRHGLCRIVPPESPQPECRVDDGMRFVAYNHYVHKAYQRWGENFRSLMALRQHLQQQNIDLDTIPQVGGVEVDLVSLYNVVCQQQGGVNAVIASNGWAAVAEQLGLLPRNNSSCRTAAAAKLDQIYCRYLLSYTALTDEERSRLVDCVDAEWRRTQLRRETKPVGRRSAALLPTGSDDSSSGESDLEEEDDSAECIVKGKSTNLASFYRVSRNVSAAWYGEQQPDLKQVEEDYWRLVTEGKRHVCVYSGSVNCSDHSRCGFVRDGKSATLPWNLKVLAGNQLSVLRAVGQVPGVTLPTLHISMLFTTGCWYSDPHQLPWLEYLHTGADKVWYCVPASDGERLRSVVDKLMPGLIRHGPVWLPSDTVMIPPSVLVEEGVQVYRCVQRAGEFVVAAPAAFVSSICSGYTLSESVLFAPTSWLPSAPSIFRQLRRSREPSMFALSRLLLGILSMPLSERKLALSCLLAVNPLIRQFSSFEWRLINKLRLLGVSCESKLAKSQLVSSPHSILNIEWKEADDSVTGTGECEVCNTSLFTSLLVMKSQPVCYCLHHGIGLIRRKKLSVCELNLFYMYTEVEYDRLLCELEDRIKALQTDGRK